MTDILQDTNVWLMVSFLIFGFLVYKKGKGALLGALDHKIQTIKNDLENAENLRVEAQELLAQYQRKHRNALKESEEIVAEAQKRAEEIRLQAEQDLKDLIERREQQLQDRLARMEQSALDEIQAYAADLAIKATHEIISDKMDKKSHNALIDNTIDALPKVVGQA